jgi:L-threonylcarbamoyladenylate synthase
LKVLCNSQGISEAVKTLENGGVIVFPSDTVYGVGCDPYNEDAVKKIYKIKRRDPSKLFPVLGNSFEELLKIAEFSEKSTKIAEKFWPGPVTLLLKIKDEKIKKSLHLDDKIAVRVPKNKCLLDLLEKCKLIVGTSANFSGTKSFNDPEECLSNFTGYDIFIDGGIIDSVGESTLIEINGELKILRRGIVSEKEILDFF